VAAAVTVAVGVGPLPPPPAVAVGVGPLPPPLAVAVDVGMAVAVGVAVGGGVAATSVGAGPPSAPSLAPCPGDGASDEMRGASTTRTSTTPRIPSTPFVDFRIAYINEPTAWN
jgi:hypothetical protein